MGRRIFVILLIAFFIIAALAAGYFSTRLTREVGLGNLIPGREEPKPTITPKPGTLRDPITKNTYADGSGVMYELEGTFLEKLEKRGDHLFGRFVLKGDSNDRYLNIYIGSLNGTIFYGKYNGSFTGTVTWSPTPADLVKDDVKPGEAVKLRYLIRFTGEKGENQRLTETDAVFNSLSAQILEGKSDYNIPSDFVFSLESLGVVR